MPQPIANIHVTVSKPRSGNPSVSEPRSGNPSVSKPHTRSMYKCELSLANYVNVNVSEPHNVMLKMKSRPFL